MPGTPPVTPRLLLPRYDNATDPADFATQVNAISDRLDAIVPSFLAGPFSALPAPSILGRIFMATDTVAQYFDLGSAWMRVSMPAGVLVPYGGAVAPPGFELCDGGAVVRNDSLHAELFAAIGTLHGAGNGSTTFNKPDSKGRVIVGAGQGSGLTNRPAASKGGAETHALSLAEMPAHNHGGATGAGVSGTERTSLSHDHPIFGGAIVTSSTPQAAAGAPATGFAPGDYTLYIQGGLSIGKVTATVADGPSPHSHNVPALSIASQGSGTAHSIVQPYLATPHIIKL